MKEPKLIEFHFDMLPSDVRRLVLDDLVLLDDNLTSTQDVTMEVEQHSFVLPMKMMFAIVILCRQGSIDIRLNLEDYHVCKNDVLVVVPGTIGEGIQFSEGTKLCIMAFPEKAFPLLMKMEHSLRFREHMTRPFIFHFSERDMTDFMQVYKLMRSVVLSDNPYKKELIMSYMEALSYYAVNQIEKEGDKEMKRQRGDTLFHEFVDAVRKHYSTERQLNFYADKLCISPKYLSRVVLQHSGRHPSDWIRDYVILEAKALLKQNNYSVQQVSDILHFPNASFFGKYFKAVVGCSPRAFQLNTIS